MTAPKVTRSAHGFAWFGFFLGILASIAANVLHADLDGSTTAELVGAAFWPTALFVSIEVLARVPWPPGRRWGAARFGGVGLVAIVAGVLSYRHMAGLLASWGEDTWNAHLGPLAVDGLMLVSATALLAISRAKQTPAPAPVEVEAEEVELAEPTEPTVLKWPEPIGPEPTADMMLARAMREAVGPSGTASRVRLVTPDELDKLAGTAYAGPPAERPDIVEPATDNHRDVTAAGGQLQRILDAIPEPPPVPVQPAKAAKPKPPRTPKQPRAPRATPAAGKDKARDYYRAEVAAGRTPTGPQLAEIGGVNRRTGTRWLDEFATELEDANV